MDYNTHREKLAMPEYGRGVQQMLDYCMTIEDRDERLRCARTIIRIMATIPNPDGDKEDDFIKKLWNHLAAISGYKLDIDYPVEIESEELINARPAQIPYPKVNTNRRNYGVIVKKFAEHLATMKADADRDALSLSLANQMKRDLCNWSNDMSDEKVMSDLASLTDGKVQMDPFAVQLISDGELLSSRISTSVKKKKKK